MKIKKIKSKLRILITTTLLLFSLSSTSAFADENNSITLTAQPNDAENSISLNWTPSDKSQNYSYRIYAKENNEEEFHSLPAKSSNIKVLNIYPSTLDGKNNDRKEGYIVKDWIEAYGKDLINVSSISLKNFNANPYGALQDKNGQWQYDVIFFGAWDNNNNQDLDKNALEPIREFSKAGHGILFGHDTLRISLPNFKSLSDLVNIKINSSMPIFGTLDVVNRSKKIKIQVEKTGLLTNYPYELKGQLEIPVCHSLGQHANGDIWIRFLTSDAKSYNNDCNFYLTTYNNSAMIQTGHSNGNATDDEQKILVNTLLYLSQVTNGNNSDSHKTQDFSAPDKPQIISLTKNFLNNETSISFESSKDNGSTYSFYVEGSPLENGVANKEKAIKSNLVSSTITTGIKGYIAVADEDKDTKLTDASMANSNTTFTCNKVYPSDYYIHVAAVDNAGNISETTTIKVPASL